MLSKKSKYAINALVYLAKKKDSGPILINEIAVNQHIPKKFLETILLDLKNSGILKSKMGKGGGYYLPHKPADVSLAEVIRLFDGAIALLPCVSYKYYEKCEECTDEATCGIRNAFKEVRDETVRILKANNLQTILDNEKKLQKSKDKPAPPKK